MRRLSGLIEGLGGTPVAGRPARDYAPSFPRLRDADDALLLARDIEERLVRAHLEALVKLPAGDAPQRRGRPRDQRGGAPGGRQRAARRAVARRRSSPAPETSTADPR